METGHGTLSGTAQVFDKDGNLKGEFQFQSDPEQVESVTGQAVEQTEEDTDGSDT